MLEFDGVTYTHNGQGQRSSAFDGTDLTEYRYDAMGSLREVSLPDGGRILYHVDGLHRRVEKEVRDANDDQVYRERYTYQDQLEPVAMQRWDANDDPVATRYFVYGLVPHVPAYMVDEQGERYAFVVDQVGSVRQVVQVSTGQVVHSMRYTAFGEVLEDAYTGGFAPQPFGYAGGLYDRETGFVRFGARDYDAFTCRWTAKDPIRFEGGDTNLFGYVFNSPLMHADPTGLDVYRCWTPFSDWRFHAMNPVQAAAFPMASAFLAAVSAISPASIQLRHEYIGVLGRRSRTYGYSMDSGVTGTGEDLISDLGLGRCRRIPCKGEGKMIDHLDMPPEMMPGFRKSDYNKLTNNCQHFVTDMLERYCGD